jgi:hypothetical protein
LFISETVGFAKCQENTATLVLGALIRPHAFQRLGRKSADKYRVLVLEGATGGRLKSKVLDSISILVLEALVGTRYRWRLSEKRAWKIQQL